MPDADEISVDNQADSSLTQDELLLASRRLERISKVGEHTIFSDREVGIGSWSEFPASWPETPHIVRGPENICGPNLIAVQFDTANGPVYFPVPDVIANLLGSAYDKGRRTALAEVRKSLGLRH